MGRGNAAYDRSDVNEMSFIHTIPEYFRRADKKGELIIFLRDLPIRFHAKKYTLLEWAEEQGEKITLEDVQKLGGKF